MCGNEYLPFHQESPIAIQQEIGTRKDLKPKRNVEPRKKKKKKNSMSTGHTQ